MLGLILRGLMLAAGAAAIAAIVIYIHGTITKDKIREELRAKGIDEDMLIKEINRCENTISLEELDGNKPVEIRGDDISYDLYEGETIYV